VRIVAGVPKKTDEISCAQMIGEQQRMKHDIYDELENVANHLKIFNESMAKQIRRPFSAKHRST
jgi:hypothetical protein